MTPKNTSKAWMVAVLASTAMFSASFADEGKSSHHSASHGLRSSPLVSKVRQATERYRDVDVAVAEGYAAGPCVSGPNGGAMGIHYVNEQLLNDDALSAEQPEALIYEPLPGGRLHLVGVEYITFAGPAFLEGHLLNYVGAPNRYGLPAFYELHVWAWRRNPNGTFADWNPRVSCTAAKGT